MQVLQIGVVDSFNAYVIAFCWPRWSTLHVIAILDRGRAAGIVMVYGVSPTRMLCPHAAAMSVLVKGFTLEIASMTHQQRPV